MRPAAIGRDRVVTLVLVTCFDEAGIGAIAQRSADLIGDAQSADRGPGWTIAPGSPRRGRTR